MQTPDAPFFCTECDLDSTGAAFEVPEGYGGIGVVIRRGGDPVGYCLKRLSPGSRVEPEQVLAWAAEGSSPVTIPPEAASDLPRFDLPSLTIAVCTRNRVEWLARCLRALTDLTSVGSKPELLVVDNAPTDDRTEEVVRRTPGVRYVREPLPGLDFARNRAVREATGDLLGFIDDDAVVDGRWLSGLYRAWQQNPDAGGFTGPILPWELRTRAQVIFELRGGFGRGFRPIRYNLALKYDDVYPCHAGIYGSGCNMVFRRDLLVALGGFDEALDTGPPLPAAGDLDIFFRVVVSGNALIHAPQMVIFHDHRAEYSALRKQMWTWGLGMITFVRKHQKLKSYDPGKFQLLLRQWFSQKIRELVNGVIQPDPKMGSVDLVAAELLGGVFGYLGEYERSMRRVARRRQIK